MAVVATTTPDDAMVCCFMCGWHGKHIESTREIGDCSACPKCGEVVNLDKGMESPNPNYIRIRAGKVAKTVEVVPGEVFIDFDADGKPLGVEVL